MKVALFTVNAFMGDDGTCYPSQETIAAAAALGVTTVRRKLAEASRLGWLARYERAKAGQQWKAIDYRACIPDALDTSKYDRKEDKWRGRSGAEIPAVALRGTLYPQLTSKKTPAAPAGPSTIETHRQPADNGGHSDESTGRSGSEDRPPTHEGPAADNQDDRPERPTKFLREVLEEVPFGEGRSHSSRPANAMRALAKDMQGVRTEEPLEARLGNARKLLVASPEFPADQLCKMYRLTPEQAFEARRSAA